MYAYTLHTYHRVSGTDLQLVHLVIFCNRSTTNAFSVSIPIVKLVGICKESPSSNLSHSLTHSQLCFVSCETCVRSESMCKLLGPVVVNRMCYTHSMHACTCSVGSVKDAKQRSQSGHVRRYWLFDLSLTIQSCIFVSIYSRENCTCKCKYTLTTVHQPSAGCSEWRLFPTASLNCSKRLYILISAHQTKHKVG